MTERQKNENKLEDPNRSMDKKSTADKPLSEKTTKDFAHYFQTTYKPPNIRKERKRFREDIEFYYNFNISEQMREIGAGKKFLIRTYGCQMNEHDSETMAGILMEMGYEATHIDEEADVIILNTCAIRENAENRVFGEIGHLKALKVENPELIIAVAGCMSQQETVVNRILEKHQQVYLIFGTHNIHRLPQLIQEAMFSKAQVVEV